MTFLMEKKRVGVLALLALLVGAAALMIGVGSASAGVCDGEPFPNDIQVSVHGVATVGVDPFIENNAVWVCLNPPGQESGVGTADPDPSSPGLVVGVWGCGWLAGGWCGDTVGFTGAEADPATTTNAPANGDSTSAASAGTDTGTCVYVDGSQTCPSGVTIAGVTVNENDLVPVVTTYTPAPPCTGINNTCVPVGATVEFFNDGSAPLVAIESAATSPQPVDVGPQCVQVNAVC